MRREPERGEKEGEDEEDSECSPHWQNLLYGHLSRLLSTDADVLGIGVYLESRSLQSDYLYPCIQSGSKWEVCRLMTRLPGTGISLVIAKTSNI